jgi:AcrR family transcriptional regulator
MATNTARPPLSRRRGRPSKRAQVLAAARAAFVEHGYAGASIESIAESAGVSTRTIYNHFDSKSELFATALRESAGHVADRLVDLVDRHLRDPGDIRAALIAVAARWAEPEPEFTEHFAMVRRIAAGPAEVPPDVVAAWDEAGPIRAHAALADRLGALSSRQALSIGDPSRAAEHLLLLTAGAVQARARYAATPLPRATIAELVEAGVDAFLLGHLPRR